MFLKRTKPLVDTTIRRVLQLSTQTSTPGSLYKRTNPKVCVVGSGPAGFYFTQHLLKILPDVTVDMYEKLPVPFGLVRYGVAPDHLEVKNVINTFNKTASHDNFRFIGNVTLGRDVNFSHLKQAYHAVVLACGCCEDAKLGIQGESLPHVLSAREFVGWYNGLPEAVNLPVRLDNVERVVILGQGNVAIDVARILLTPVDILKKSDITEYALETLKKSRVKSVSLVGRRGPLQVAFTIKEFREMTKLSNVRTVFKNEQLEGVAKLVNDLPRARKRLTELLLKTAADNQHKGELTFQPVFLRKPVEITPNAVKFAVNSIDHQTGTVSETDSYESINADLVLRSIGYRALCPDRGVPFNSQKGVVLNEPGVYSAGWICTGPVGVILSTMNNAFEQASFLAEDIRSSRVNLDENKPGYELIEKELKDKGVFTVDFNGWKRIDEEEVKRGARLGKPREKIVSVNEMLSIGAYS